MKRPDRGDRGVELVALERASDRNMETLLTNPNSRKTIDAAPVPTPNLSDLIERAGFHVRGRRADCIHCEGQSRLTVAFNDEVAFCHRCKWTGNIRTLTRELGLPLAPEAREAWERRVRVGQFEEWGNTCWLILVRRLRFLTRRAELAKSILTRFPDCESAWGALADLYHSEAIFTAAFEFLACEKLPEYLEQPMTREKLRAAFEEAAARVRASHVA